MKLKKIVNLIAKYTIDFRIELEKYIIKIAPDVLETTFGFKENQSVVIEDCIYRGKGKNFKHKKFKLKICKKNLEDFIEKMRINDFLNREDFESFIFASLQSYFFMNYGSLTTVEDEDIKFCIKGITNCIDKTIYQVSKLEIKKQPQNFPYAIF